MGPILHVYMPSTNRHFEWVAQQVGHLRRMEKIAHALSNHPGIQLAGAAYRGTGIPDCIRDASQAAVKIIDFLKKTPVASSPAALNDVVP